MAFATSSKIPGLCDRCGREVKLNSLRRERIAGALQFSLVCRECFDPDHPQNWQGKVRVVIKDGVQNPRSDSVELGSVQGLFGFNPVGPLSLRLNLGDVYA